MSISAFTTANPPADLMATGLLVLEAGRGHDEISPEILSAYEPLNARMENDAFFLTPDMNGLSTPVDMIVTGPDSTAPVTFTVAPGTAIDQQLETALGSKGTTPEPSSTPPAPEF